MARGVRPDIVTDQTSAHDPINGYLPQGWTMAQWRDKRESDPDSVEKAARASMKVHVAAMVDFWNAGVPTLDYGNNIRQVAKDEGLENAFAFPGFVPAYIRPLFCQGIGPFRWCALSGDPEDIYKTDAKVKELIPDDEHSAQLARHGARAHCVPGPACPHLLGRAGATPSAGLGIQRNGRDRRTESTGRDRARSSGLRARSLRPTARPRRMKDGSDAVSDWPLLNALLNTRIGCDLGVASIMVVAWAWASSQHSGMVICCDGTDDAARRIGRVLWNDPATGVMRHADAGYETALECAREHGLNLPGILGE